MAIVAFAGDAYVQCPLTSDYAAAKLFLRAVDPEQMQQGGTNIGAALPAVPEAARERRPGCQGPGGGAALGRRGPVRGGDARRPRSLKAAGIKVYAVGIGSEAGEPIPVLGKRRGGGGLYEGQLGAIPSSPGWTAPGLEAVAQLTGGEFFYRPAAWRCRRWRRALTACRRVRLRAASPSATTSASKPSSRRGWCSSRWGFCSRGADAGRHEATRRHLPADRARARASAPGRAAGPRPGALGAEPAQRVRRPAGLRRGPVRGRAQGLRGGPEADARTAPRSSTTREIPSTACSAWTRHARPTSAPRKWLAGELGERDLYNLGNALADLGRTQEAISVYRRALLAGAQRRGRPPQPGSAAPPLASAQVRQRRRHPDAGQDAGQPDAGSPDGGRGDAGPGDGGRGDGARGTGGRAATGERATAARARAKAAPTQARARASSSAPGSPETLDGTRASRRGTLTLGRNGTPSETPGWGRLASSTGGMPSDCSTPCDKAKRTYNCGAFSRRSRRGSRMRRTGSALFAVVASLAATAASAAADVASGSRPHATSG